VDPSPEFTAKVRRKIDDSPAPAWGFGWDCLRRGGDGCSNRSGGCYLQATASGSPCSGADTTVAEHFHDYECSRSETCNKHAGSDFTETGGSNEGAGNFSSRRQKPLRFSAYSVLDRLHRLRHLS
jgi:hypothetical protein